MSTKYFCDICNTEMKSDESIRLCRKKERLRIEITPCLDGVWNKGNVCHDCIMDVATNGDKVKGS